MRTAPFFGAVFAMLLAGGCAATGSVNYSPPGSLTLPKNEVVIDEPFDRVWDRMVKNLSADFFVINNIEKASRLMNVSFSANDPSQYIDCGLTTRTFSNIRGEQTYQYETTKSSRYSIANPNGLPLNVVRTTKLDGRSNIYVAPEGEKTLVRVNTRYILGINLKGYTLAGQFADTHDESWSFNTREVFEKYASDFKITVKCVSIGTLENKILQAAKSSS